MDFWISFPITCCRSRNHFCIIYIWRYYLTPLFKQFGVDFLSILCVTIKCKDRAASYFPVFTSPLAYLTVEAWPQLAHYKLRGGMASPEEGNTSWYKSPSELHLPASQLFGYVVFSLLFGQKSAYFSMCFLLWQVACLELCFLISKFREIFLKNCFLVWSCLLCLVNPLDFWPHFTLVLAYTPDSLRPSKCSVCGSAYNLCSSVAGCGVLCTTKGPVGSLPCTNLRCL